MNKNDEQILVVEREKLFEKETTVFQGFKPLADFKEIALEDITVGRRGDLEVDETQKQLITYAIVKVTNQDKILLYKRLSGSGESRLVNKTSIGVGGHSNLHDAKDFNDLMFQNFKRELEEELEIEGGIVSQHIGYINDDSDDVGKVHLGVVYLAQVGSEDAVTVNETDTLAIEFKSVEDIKQDDKLESWSKLLINSEEAQQFFK